jgi:hypothetical protein
MQQALWKINRTIPTFENRTIPNRTSLENRTIPNRSTLKKSLTGSSRPTVGGCTAEGIPIIRVVYSLSDPSSCVSDHSGIIFCPLIPQKYALTVISQSTLVINSRLCSFSQTGESVLPPSSPIYLRKKILLITDVAGPKRTLVIFVVDIGNFVRRRNCLSARSL